MTGKEAIDRLILGNKRYQAGNLEHPHQNLKRRADLANGQQASRVS